VETILDEHSVVPDPERSPAERLATFAATLRKIDLLGGRPVLRSVRQVADRDIKDGQGLRFWCFDRGTARDVGLFVAGRLEKAPFLDGPDGLFSAREAETAMEVTLSGKRAIGIAYAALTDQPSVALLLGGPPPAVKLTVIASVLDENGLRTEEFDVYRFVTSEMVRGHETWIRKQVDQSIGSGQELMRRQAELFPHLRFGPRVVHEFERLRGCEPFFRLLRRHLFALELGAQNWPDGQAYSPVGVTWSIESKPTLEHSQFGPMRDFTMPEGYEPIRWTTHTKLSGPQARRLYFHPDRGAGGPCVLVGYFGPHLPTVKYRT